MSAWRSLYPFSSQYFVPPLPDRATSASGRASELQATTAPRMHYIDEGEGEQCIICVHGNPTWSFTFRKVAIQLRNRARVIAIDHIGCGLSDKPENYRYTLDQHIDNLVALVRQLDLQRITLLVHDWGGAIGLGAGLEVAERIGGIVVLNTAAFPPPYIPLRISACRWPIVGNYAMRQWNVFARAALTMTLNRLPKLADDVAEGLIAPYDSWQNRVAIARFVQDIPTRREQATWKRLEAIEQQLPRFRHLPIELVWGMRDWCFRPECLERLLQLWPQANATRLDDVGHYVMEEASDEVLTAITKCLAEQRL